MFHIVKKKMGGTNISRFLGDDDGEEKEKPFG